MISPILSQTPVQRISCPEAEASGNVIYVKRDDLLPFSLGGNKVRIAVEFVRDMREKGLDALIMYGDRRSNLCRVLASLCHAERIPCVMVATSAAGPEDLSFNARLVDAFGVEVLECDASSIAQTVDQAFDLLRSRGLKPYYIYGDRTGTGNEGVAARAYARAYDEIRAWEKDEGRSVDLLVTPYGTGSTQGGLVAGSLRANDDRDIVGISISSRSPERAREVLLTTVRSWFADAGLECPADYESHVHLETAYACGGYGAPDARVRELIKFMWEENSLPMDQTYTGKAFRGMLDYLRDHEIADKSVLFLHTGGLPLFFDQLDGAH